MGTKRKREQKFTRQMQIKLMAVFAFVLLLLVALNLVIAHINVTNGDKYAKQVLSQQTYDSRTIPYRRGEIQDRNGNVLAKSEKVYNVILDCYAINSVEDYIEPTIAAVSEQFDLDSATVRDVICSEETKDSRYQVIKKEIGVEEKKAFEDYVDTSEDKSMSQAKREELENVQGVWFEEDYVRTYPMDTLACTVVGFSNKLNDGISGLESYYDDVLNGVDGREYGYLNQDMELEENIIEPEDGNSIVSTIDMNIQQVVEKYIAQLEEEKRIFHWFHDYAFNKQNIRYQEAFEKLRSEIYAHPEYEWNLETMAKKVNMSTRSLQKIYKKFANISCIAEVVESRMIRAKMLLARTSLDVSEISIKCGYHNVEHFCRQFRQHENCSPSSYRKKHKI